MTDSDPAADPDRDASDRAGPEGDTVGGHPPTADADQQATPRLVNPPDSDSSESDRSADDPGEVREPDPIEPEAPRGENVVFVLLGVLGTVALLATAIVPGLL